ncbi:phosphatidylinositol mannoside acyltransferase [Jonesia quinghaiensis]|uniref:phosphatidylinositol mannoside acyltransferase n=1 Tax=Jonesia quinghaiensis TaxID=262806 RepID=UPI00048B8CB4|nr:phosphatidylinositol mannoside acyltransferase [Jonesia quinghaiensis]
MNLSTLYMLAWRHAWRVPGPLWRGAMAGVADLTWLMRGKGVTQLERNLSRIRPEATPQQIRRLSHQGMRSYMRYFGEAFVVAHLTAQQRDARVRVVGRENIDSALAHGGSPILALSHQGNWDLAGMWASVHLRPVLTVAERLKPEELFTEFRQFRETLGMSILAAGDDGVFRQLMRASRTEKYLICLLADRDLSHSGVEVSLFGRTARVAKGPAALALSNDVALVPSAIYYERLRGERRRQAGSPWGIVIEFCPPVYATPGATGHSAIADLSQQWVSALETPISKHPQDWHMLQKVFVEDLDAARYSTVTAPEENV